MARRPISVIELAGYRRRVSSLLSRDEQDAVIDLIAYEPTCGDLIPGTGGLRKVRVAADTAESAAEQESCTTSTTPAFRFISSLSTRRMRRAI
jgi:hypothetical protein